jgi:hypothetical protein
MAPAFSFTLAAEHDSERGKLRFASHVPTTTEKNDAEKTGTEFGIRHVRRPL